MVNRIFLLLLYLLLACTSQKQNDTATIDSTAVNDSTASRGETPQPTITNYSAVDPKLKQADSLFNFLARQKIVRGEFGDVTVITEDFLDPENLNKSRNLIAVLVHSGEGAGYNTQFQTLYSVLAIFERKDNQIALVDFLDLGEGGSYGIQESHTESDSIMLAKNKFAAMIHYKSSEEGAGDSGYRNDNVEIYVLLNEKITKVLEHEVEQFSFASDEATTYREQTTTSAISVMNELTNGLFNIRIETSKSETGFEEDPEGEGVETEGVATEDTEPKESEEQAEPEAVPDDGIDIYKWNGTLYEKVVD